METIGRFELHRVLGRGAGGTVYEARDPLRGGRVALKVVLQSLLANAARRGRFLSEVRAAAAFDHANLVHVVEAGEHEGQVYVAQELVEGVDLERVVSSGKPFPVEWTIDVMRQVCQGLHRAHEEGLVHAELKPSKVRVTPEGVVKVLDLGHSCLKSFEAGGGDSRIAGVHYRAPEVIEGKKASPRSDIFSVGAIFYELLASTKPFSADTATGVMFKIRHEQADPALLPVSDFSPELEAVVLRALQRDPGQRHPTLEALRGELASLVREAAPRMTRRALPRPEDAAEPPRDEPAPAATSSETEGLHAVLMRARGRGESKLALAIVRRLLDIDPDDERARATAEEIEAEEREIEAEQLCAIALAYAADGEVAQAAEIAETIEKLSPWSPRYLQLQVYLDEETARRSADSLAARGQEQLSAGDLDAALASAEEALTAFPSHPGALEVRQKAETLRSDRPSVASPRPEPDRMPEPARPAPRRGEVESLTSAALDHFLRNDHPRARRAVEKALALDPQNRRAQELLKLLGVLG